MCRGVSAISFSAHDLCIYTAGADGMICTIDPQTGNMTGKFRASTKAISCMSVSSGTHPLALFVVLSLHVCKETNTILPYFLTSYLISYKE